LIPRSFGPDLSRADHLVDRSAQAARGEFAVAESEDELSVFTVKAEERFERTAAIGLRLVD
jgi:hypothetical protein